MAGNKSELILIDRLTGGTVKVFFYDGMLAVDNSDKTPDSEPILIDVKSGQHWKIFIYDGIVSHEETADIATGNIDLIDINTSVLWRFQVVDGVLAYICILGIQVLLDSRMMADDKLRMDSRVKDSKIAQSIGGNNLYLESWII